MNIKRLFAPVSRLYRLKRLTMQICMTELIKKTMRQKRFKAFLMQMIMTMTTTTSARTKMYILKIYRAKDALSHFSVNMRKLLY
jgi:hypothetical protein